MTTYRDRLTAGIHAPPGTAKEMTKDDLKAALAALNQPVSGTKPELEARLAEAQNNA